MVELSDISRRIWEMKYRLYQPDGTPADAAIEDTWRRVAAALAEPEADAAGWSERFYGVLENFEFLPAGRILAGAGTGRSVTLFNCFVMGRIPDDMSGIFEHLREAALTMQQGGGIGYDFSTLRPKGAPVKGVGADASGPVSFMDVWDSMCRTIMSAGSRRGAMMATLRCDHPDIETFVDAKRDPARLRMFNLSVLVTDRFVRALERDGDWDLVFDGEVHRTVRARDLWDRIMRSTYDYAEPGVIFIDRVNALNNLSYCESIYSTNPCVTTDAWIMTGEGPRQVADLLGRPFDAVVDGACHPSDPAGFFSTGSKQVLKLVTEEGHCLRLTADHPVFAVSHRTRYRQDAEWRAAGDLAPGDTIVLHDHADLAGWPGRYGEEEGYLVGLLVGDGTLKSDKAVISVWPGAQAVNGGYERPGVAAVMDRALAAARSLPHRSDFSGWLPVQGRGEMRMALGALRRIAAELGLVPGRKTITPAIERESSAFYRGFLRGLFDADGTVGGDHTKGVSVRLPQSDGDMLAAVQRMLLRLGVVSRIYRDRRPSGQRLMPDGAGGTRLYDCRAENELVISGSALAVFDDRIGFVDGDKRARLTAMLSGYRRRLNRSRMAARVASIAPDGVEPVFDVRIPGINAFDANGIYVHNCGEQPLPAYGACLLGSVNLARLVREPFTEAARLDVDRLEEIVPVAVRMMDNVVDLSRFALEEQAREARAKRRIGLGVTGLADALILCGVPYGSERSTRLTRDWLEAIRNAAYRASVALAAEKGPFPLFDAEAYLDRPMIQALDDDLRADIARHGIRNGLLTSIAPTGTISLLADNVSSGIEPVFSRSFSRSVLMPDGSREVEQVEDYAYRLFRRTVGEDAPLPDAFVEAGDLAPREHLAIQAAAQPYVDSSISKTINCPADLSFEDFKDVYTEAYQLGCKGCTTYRPNPVTGAVLEARQEPARPTQAVGGAGEADVVYMTKPLDRPEALPGCTYKLRWPDSDHAIYVTVNDIVQEGPAGDQRRRPFEVFINSKNMEHYAWTVALTRMISAVFRRGGDVSFVVEELKAVFDPRGGQWMDGRYVPSLLAAIGEVIERHMVEIGFLPADRTPAIEHRREAVNAERGGEAFAERTPARQCPKCGQAALIREANCDVCLACGYSRCF